MPNEAEQELIAGVMTSDWLGCGLVGHERAQNDWLWSKVGTLRNMEHKSDSLSEQSARNNSHAFNAQGRVIVWFQEERYSRTWVLEQSVKFIKQ